VNAKLVERKVKAENLYLDPNNPRFADILNRQPKVLKHKITEPSTQETALQNILQDRFEVKQLKDSILRMGFLPVDRLVVIPLTEEEEKFMVIEGNRRLAAVKDLLRDQASGEIDIPESVLPSITEIPVLVIDEKDEQQRTAIAKIYQGIRHISGIRPFGPYQQAELIYSMQEREGRDLGEIAEILGIMTRRANILRRVYSAMVQMRNDSDYREFVRVEHFSDFDELLKLPKLREWAGWDDEAGRFDNTENIHMFYDWIIGIDDESGQRLPPKIGDHKDVRLLRDLFDDQIQFKVFCESPNLSITDAANRVVPKEPVFDWRATLSNQLYALRQIPAVDIQDPRDEDTQLLKDVMDQCGKLLSMIDKQKAG